MQKLSLIVLTLLVVVFVVPEAVFSQTGRPAPSPRRPANAYGIEEEALIRKEREGLESLQQYPWTLAKKADGVFVMHQEGSTLKFALASGDVKVEKVLVDGVEATAGEDGWAATRAKPKKKAQIVVMLEEGEGKLTFTPQHQLHRGGEVAVLCITDKKGKMRTSDSFWADRLPEEMRN